MFGNQKKQKHHLYVGDPLYPKIKWKKMIPQSKQDGVKLFPLKMPKGACIIWAHNAIVDSCNDSEEDSTDREESSGAEAAK